jgi:hypothetical protein
MTMKIASIDIVFAHQEAQEIPQSKCSEGLALRPRGSIGGLICRLAWITIGGGDPRGEVSVVIRVLSSRNRPGELLMREAKRLLRQHGGRA